jgi:hypothetical protein
MKYKIRKWFRFKAYQNKQAFQAISSNLTTPAEQYMFCRESSAYSLTYVCIYKYPGNARLTIHTAYSKKENFAL